MRVIPVTFSMVIGMPKMPFKKFPILPAGLITLYTSLRGADYFFIGLSSMVNLDLSE